MQAGQCRIKLHEVDWPRKYRGRYAKKNAPTGEFIDATFKDWLNGELVPAVEDAIGTRGSRRDLWNFCHAVFCRSCPQVNLCERRHNPFYDGIGRFIEMGPLWFTLNRNERRAILILSVLGERNNPRRGYRRGDIEKIAGYSGKSHSQPDNLAHRLCELRVLRVAPRPGRKRYEYIWPSYFDRCSNKSLSASEEARHAKNYWDEPGRKLLRLDARKMAERLRELASTGGVHEWAYGRFVGEQPPSWFAESLKECVDSLWYAMNSPSEPSERMRSEKEILDRFLALGKSVSEKVLSAPDDETDQIVNGWGPDSLFILDMHTTYSDTQIFYERVKPKLDAGRTDEAIAAELGYDLGAIRQMIEKARELPAKRKIHTTTRRTKS